jgi:uncharacterized protein YdeI (YjbR/CyaY-like superfamily)
MIPFSAWAKFMVAAILPLIYLTEKREKDMDTSLESFRFVRTGEEVKTRAGSRAVEVIKEIAADEKKLAELRKADADAEAGTFRKFGVSQESDIEHGLKRKHDVANALNTLVRNVDPQEKYQLTFGELLFIGF